MRRDVAFVDLFCGAGGLTHGLISEGLDVVAGVYVDDVCHHPFETNNFSKFILKNVARVYYSLKRLGLDTDPTARCPRDQQIVLLNRDAIRLQSENSAQ